MFLRLIFSVCFAIYIVVPKDLSAELQKLYPEIISKICHDTQAFTQGLAFYNGLLYESAGLYGQSSLRQIDPSNGKILKQINLQKHLFAEGIAINSQYIYQITWKENVLLIYDRILFTLLKEIPIITEGWGMCNDGSHILMTHGSAQITKHNTTDFTGTSQCTVNYDKLEIESLNDIECVEDSIYANVYKKEYILRLNKNSGEVTAIIDASKLLSSEEKKALMAEEDVLNGIAYDPQKKTFWITGKRWPWIFEVKFLPQQS